MTGHTSEDGPMSAAMTHAEREAFLAEPRMAVLAVAMVGRAPLAVPVWYSYRPGGLVSIITGDGTRKAGLVRAAGRASLCVHSDELPYRYVSVEGPVVETEHPAAPDERLSLARRYLGIEGGDAYIAATTATAATMTTFRLAPEHWLTQDQSRL
jgi:nitroimidazol reductase NimA-like FMN-containing flavoprotein (pyridoxamine 5'-phosphate oxidase superfamily)